MVWTSGRLDKLAIYRKLEMAEGSFWRKGHIQPYVLRGEHSVPAERSEVLPGLDLDLLTRFIDQPATSTAS